MKLTVYSGRESDRLSRAPRLALVAGAVLFVLIAFCGRAQAAPADTLMPVYNWWSHTLGDNFATTDPAWAATRPGEVRGAYRFERVVGYVFDPARPQPPGTKRLFRWWSPSRGHQLLTADPNWAPAVNPHPTRTTSSSVWRASSSAPRGPARGP